jgi:HSP20 family protein
MAEQKSKAQGETGKPVKVEQPQSSSSPRSMAQRGGGVQPYGGGGPLSLVDWMFDRMQRDMLGWPLFEPSSAMPSMERLARLEVRDRDNELVITAEVPGVNPGDVSIEARDDMLTIRGETQQEAEEEGETYESAVRFVRQVRLPPDVDVDRAQASIQNGLLRIRLPRRSSEDRVKHIPIGAGESQGEHKAA